LEDQLQWIILSLLVAAGVVRMAAVAAVLEVLELPQDFQLHKAHHIQ
jgi:hypothetical protein